MIRKIFTVALLSGLLAGIGNSVVQELTTTPLILKAEFYENAAQAMRDGNEALNASVVLASSDGGAEAGAGDTVWAPAEGVERSIYTGGSNILAGFGFALLLVAAFTVYGGAVTGRTGVIWGLAGFATFALFPSLGLSPELPGMFAADLAARQGWWLFAVFATGTGLGLTVFGKNWGLRIAGILIVAAPHIVGAPAPETIGSNVPAELAGHFVAASLAASAIFWAMLGWLSGTFWQRVSQNG